jgi:uncharacterized protein YfaS (alpha-2-macroglobulin family)
MNMHDKVRQAGGKLLEIIVFLGRPLVALASLLFGDVDWQPPRWLGWLAGKLVPLGRWCHAQAAWVILVLILLGGAGWVATHGPAGGWKTWWEWQTFSGAKPDQPSSGKPDQVEVRAVGIRINGPQRTLYDGDGKPRPVVFKFSASAAPLAWVGKEAQDVQLEPVLAGKWTWIAANQLEFLPDEDWPVGERYTVTLGAKALVPHIKAERTLTFLSPQFVATIKNAEFYQDPVQVSLRKAVFDVDFSHPVNPESFEKRLRLQADSAIGNQVKAGETMKFTVTYDKLRLSASVHSEPLQIPQSDMPVSLHIGAGILAQRGGKGSENEVVEAVAIPGLFSLDITGLKQLIVTADNGEPENLLQITADMAVHEKEMNRAVAAWLLPANGPDGKQPGYAWKDSEAINEAVLKKSKKVALSQVSGERESTEGSAFKFVGEPGRYLFVRIQKGLKSAGGYQLASNRDEIMRVKRSAPELSIMSKGSLLALSGDKKLPIIVRDLPGVRLEIGRLLPQQLQHLVTQSQGDMSRPEFYSGITPDHLSERFEREIPLNLKPGKTHYETVDFATYLKADNADRRGIFLLSVQGYDPKSKNGKAVEYEPAQRRYSEGEGEGEGEEGYSEDNPEEVENVDPGRMRDRRLVIVTDLGVVAKRSLDGGRDVFVQSISSGQPVAGASVEIWSRNGAVLVSQTSDARGHAVLPSVNGMQREKMPVVLVIRKGGDLSFLPLNRADRNLDLSRFDIGGVRSAATPNQIQAYLFSDRGIYRPGDTMNIGILAKSLNWAQKLTDLPVEVEVIDARGLVVRRDKLKLGAAGMAEFSHSTQDTSPTGNYTINLNLARDSGSSAPGAVETPPLRLGSVSVKVQEFLPDRMKVAARLSQEAANGWVHPKDLLLKVNVQNLFGTPAPNRRLEAQMTLAPAYPAFRAHPDYFFFDPARAKENYREPLAEGSTDDKGNAEFDLSLQRYAQATYQLRLLVKAFEPEGGRSVAAEAGALVSDRPYLVGYKADGDLGYVSSNSVLNVNFIAIDPTSKKTAVTGLRLVRLEQKVVSVLMKQANGLFKYESRNKETVLKEEAFTLAAGGSNVMLVTSTPGNFAYALRDAQGLELARVDYSVAGNGNVSRSLDRNAELQLSLNKKDYQPGEDIELSIRAPYAGSGLITIERDKVFTHQWFTAKNTASVQKITLPKDFEGNGYVSVQFVRDLASNEIYMSPLSYGVVSFATSLAKRTNVVSLSAPKLIKPGQTAKFRLETKQPSRVVLFAVDEGILQVARYQSPDPLKHFFQKRALEVGTQQTLDLILPEFKKLMQAAPGGDAEGLLGKHLNPFKRRTDKPVAYWSGIVEVNGSREFSYTVPESFNGSLRVMAVTVNDDAVSASTATTLVRGDLILLPNVPVAMSPGDEVEIGIGVANQTKGSGKEAPVALTLTVAPGLEVVGGAKQVLKIGEGSEASTKFLVKAKAGAEAQLGSANVTFTAQVGATSARLGTDLSIRPASAYVTQVQSGMFRGEAALAKQTDLYPNFRREELALSTSPWAFSAGLLQYLEAYPHGCSEQITSQTFPAVILAARPEVVEQLKRLKRNDGQAPDAHKTFARYLSQVRVRQGSDGGIAMWPGAQSDLFATTYVVNLLVEAKARKFAVPNDLLQRANTYLQTRLAEVSRYDYQWRVQAQAAYLLTRQGVPVSAALVNLQEGLRQRLAVEHNADRQAALRRDLGAVYLAAAFRLTKQDKAANELLQPAWEELLAVGDPWKNWHWNYYYDPLVHQATLIQLGALHFPERIKTLPMDTWSRLAKAIQNDYYQSLSAARLVLAIDAYAAQAGQSAAGKVGVAAVNAAGLAKNLEVPQQLALAKLAVPVDSTTLTLRNGGALPLFYAWSESGYERNQPKEAVIKGLEIIHEYLDAKGKVVSEAQVGDELTVRVRVRATERNRVEQVALVDVLPGGLEPVLTAPADSAAPDVPLWRQRLGGNSTWAIDYADIREDRVVFYGNVDSSLTEVTYQVRATNAGSFVVPAAYGEAMYERRIHGRSAGATFKVNPVSK